MYLIDADALCDECGPSVVKCVGSFCCVKMMPEIDAVPVVRCKDCKHWSRNIHVNKEHGLCRTLSFIGITMHENDFCSRGERKENEH